MSKSITRFAFPTLIHFGAGARKLVAAHLLEQGIRRPLIVTDRALAALPVTEDRLFKRPFSSPTAPRTRQNRGGTQRPKRLNLPLDAGRSLLGVDSPVERRLFWRHLRVSPCHRTTSIGHENTRTQPTPAARVAGSPELSRLGSFRPLAAPGHGPAHEAVPALAGPSA